MSNFEGLEGGDLGQFETGSRPGIEPEAESYTNEELDRAADGLRSTERYRLLDSINRLDNNTKATKEKLAGVLNQGGFGWGTFEKIVKDPAGEEAVNAMIVAWAGEVEIAADAAAVRNADQALIQNIENF
jgi:hypothetical protein